MISSPGRRFSSSAVPQLWNGNGWENSERTTYTIDHDPSTGLNITGGLYEVWDSRWVPTADYHLEQVADDVVETSREWDQHVSQWRSRNVPSLLLQRSPRVKKVG